MRHRDHTPTQPHPGLFIALEGGEGVGKSTQLARLHAHLTEQGHTVAATREPGATPIGTRLRALILDPETGDLDPRTEALLFAADRAEHAATLIRPHLNAGHIVITDRYIDSSAAYQGIVRGLGADTIRALSGWATNDLNPDIVLVLDADPDEATTRATTTEFGQPDRIEAAVATQATLLRDSFRDQAEHHPDTYRLIDATGTPADVTDRLIDAITTHPAWAHHTTPHRQPV